MRKIKLYLFLTVSLINCQQNKSPNINKKVVEIVSRISPEKRITYAIHVNSFTPYELYLDDILIKYDREDISSHTTENMNIGFEASAKGETSIVISGKQGSTTEGIYIEPSIGFG